MRIICITGLIGSGKDTVSDYIVKKYKYTILHYSDILREMCRSEGMKVTRDNLQNLRLRHGNNFLAEEAIKRIGESKHDRFLLIPMRRSEDFLIPKKKLKNVVMIHIDANQKTRFSRMKNRKRENDPQTLEEFKRQEKREFAIYDFDKTFSLASHKITNNKGKKYLYAQIDAIMNKIEKM